MRKWRIPAAQCRDAPYELTAEDKIFLFRLGIEAVEHQQSGRPQKVPARSAAARTQPRPMTALRAAVQAE